MDTLRSRLAVLPWHTLELAFIVLLWQASTGVFLLSLVQQYLPDQLEANAAFPGYALAIYAAGRFLLQAPAGWLADRLGRRRTLTLGIAVSMPSVYLMLQVQDASSFLAFSALYGAGSAAIWPSIMAYVGDTHEPSARGKTLNVLNLSQLLGLGVGTMAGVTLLDLISYQAAFAACLGFSTLALAFAYRGARAGAAQPARAARPRFEMSLPRWLFSPRVLLLASIALLLSIGTTIQAPVVAAYAQDVLHTKLHVLALMLLAPAAAAAFVAMRLGHLADRFGRQLPLIGGLAVAAGCYFALSQVTHPFLAVNLVVLAGLAYAISIPAWGAAALDATEFGGRGLMLGVLATIQGVGGAVGQAVGGLSNAAWGPLAPFKMGAIMLMLALFLTVAYLHNQRGHEAAVAA
ncbi:MAG: MFS transporter [Dehalococcoidia bacterium]|nr:MFS transporter [Dehalococcoidia bacterium]